MYISLGYSLLSKELLNVMPNILVLAPICFNFNFILEIR